MKIQRPTTEEYSTFYEGYVSNAKGDVIQLMHDNLDGFIKILSSKNLDLGYRYAPDKWSVRECIVHIADADRIFTYRANRIARGDKTPLPGWEQDQYIANNNFDHLSEDDLTSLIKTTINSTISFFRNMLPSELEKTGIASDNPISVRALAYINAGHGVHHLELFKEKYGIS